MPMKKRFSKTLNSLLFYNSTCFYSTKSSNFKNDNQICSKNQSFLQLHPLIIENLKTNHVKLYNNLLLNKNNILNSYKNISGIYLLHNLINGKQYIGSAHNLRIRLASYFYPSRLKDKRYISNSILKYGHENFSLVILEVLGPTNTISKKDILIKEQHYIKIYQPALNINPIAGSSLGFHHSEESKQKIAQFKLGKSLSTTTKQYLSELFKGKNNPFFGKSHKQETLIKLSQIKKGSSIPNKSLKFKK